MRECSMGYSHICTLTRATSQHQPHLPHDAATLLSLPCVLQFHQMKPKDEHTMMVNSHVHRTEDTKRTALI